MTLTVTNGTLSEISPYFMPKAKDAYDAHDDVKKVLKLLFTPAIASAPMSITDANNKSYTEDDIVDTLMRCCGEIVDTNSEDLIAAFMKETMRYYADGPARELFLNQVATKSKLPLATSIIKYTIKTDVIPTCKDFVAGKATEELLQASIGYTFRQIVLGVYFLNEVAFDQFKLAIGQQFQQIMSLHQIDPAVQKKFNEFQKLSLNNELLETIRLRNDVSEDNDEYSFSRLLYSLLMANIHQNPQESGIIPFDVEQVICPTCMTFINVSKHAHSKASSIGIAWKELADFINLPVKLVSSSTLLKQTAIARAKRASAALAAHAVAQAQNTQRAQTFKFGKEAPNAKIMIIRVIKILHKMKDVSMSDNVYKMENKSFAKASRRNPDDYNLMGKSTVTHYHPDLHLYIDTSGSISEENYESMVKACIALAQKLNVNLYFNSFSNVLSTCTKLHIRDMSKKDIYQEFERVPKVTGGTNYEQIWKYINQSKKRQKELSIILSDFQWTPGSKPCKHPENLYYMPCLNMDWNTMCRCAEDFCKSMVYIEPDIRKRCLM